MTGNNSPAAAVSLFGPGDLAAGPDGGLYLADTGNHQIRRAALSLSGFSLSEHRIASADGRERYVFSASGRHLRTEDTLTEATLSTFTYDASGRLSQVTDVHGNRTTIERDASGKPTAIVAPFGQRTTLRLDAGGYLDQITNSAGEAVTFTYTPEGLMTSMTDARQQTYQFTYDAQGRLTRDDDPAGGFITLSRTGVPANYTVSKTTALGRITQYHIERLGTGGTRRRVTAPDGTQSVTGRGLDGVVTTTRADGTLTATQQGPDPRFGMPAAIPTITTTTTPGGLLSTTTTQREVIVIPTLIQTDTTAINGRTSISVYEAATRTTTDTSPEGRQSTTTLDARGRVTQRAVSGLTPTDFTHYDVSPPAGSNGKLKTITQGDRTTTFVYNPQGYLASITDPEGRQTQMLYDAAGRVQTQTLPSDLPQLREVQYDYDANGNVESVTPPAKPAHEFTYTPVDLEEDYIPPLVPGTGATTSLYNPDRQLEHLDRPDTQDVTLHYARQRTTHQPGHRAGAISLHLSSHHRAIANGHCSRR